MTIEVPEHVPWLLHRVATSGRYHDGLRVIRTQWTLADVLDAHDVLDALDEAEARAIDEARDHA